MLPHSLLQWIVHLAVTPGGYLVEFGVFAVGTIAFLISDRLGNTRRTPIGRLLLIGAPVALILVTFVRSVILYNDFGWRAVWLAQAPAMLWTASVLCNQRRKVMRSPVWVGAFALGLFASIWDLVGLRLIHPTAFLNFVNEHPEVNFDARGAYGWIDRNVPATVIIQHNPTQGRALNFGLYTDRPVAVADHEARLFGAQQDAVEARISVLSPIFKRAMPVSELRERASAAGVGGLLLTSADPLWRLANGPPVTWTCQYRTMHSCVMLLEGSR